MFAWMVDCKTCQQRFAVKKREIGETLTPGKKVGSFECPHCHEVDEYIAEECYPGEGKIRS